MSDVIDIITNLSFTADTTKLDAAYKRLTEIIELITKHSGDLNNLNILKDAASSKDIERLEAINKKHRETTKALQDELTALKALIAGNDNLKQSIENNIASLTNYINSTKKAAAEDNNAAKGLSTVSAGSKDATFTLTNLNYIVQDLPYGFIGISNNITPLVQSFSNLSAGAGGLRAALAAMGAALIGPQGIFFAISVISSLLITFGDRLFDSGEKAEEAVPKFEEFTKSLNKLLKSLKSGIFDEKIEIGVLFDVAKRGGVAGDKAISDLRSKAPGIFGTKDKPILSDEDIKRGAGMSQLLSGTAYKKKFETAKNYISDSYKKTVEINEALEKNGAAYKAQLEIVGKYEKEFLISKEVPIMQTVTSITYEHQKKKLDKILEEGKALRAQKAAIEESSKRTKEELSGLYIGASALEKADELELDKDKTGRSKSTPRQKNVDLYQEALRSIEEESNLSKLYSFAIKEATDAIDAELKIYDIINQRRIAQGIIITDKQKADEEKQLKETIASYKQIRSVLGEQIELQSLLQKADTADAFGKTRDAAKFRLEAKELDIKIRETNIDTDIIKPIDNFSTRFAQPKIADREISKTDYSKQIKDEEKRRKEERKIAEDSAKEIQDNIFAIMQQGIERQKTLLDLEVQIRSERVNQAVLLAQQGNAEILKSEQDRLNKTQKEREKVARRQVELNNIMAASSAALTMAKSLETIATAGTGGEGYSAPIRILAAVAALSAGFAAVASLAKSANSFKDGVVNFNGAGTTTSDSNQVYISRGESVITAKATKAYAPILEAMNANKPLPMPYTAIMNNQVGVRQDYRTLEKRLDRLIEAHEKNSVSVKTMVTNGQIANIVESERRFNRLQWS